MRRANPTPTLPILTGAASAPPQRARRARPKRPACHDGNAYPWRCVVLGVDTATKSGWAVRVAGKLVWSGECDSRDDDALDDAVRLALQCAGRPPAEVMPGDTASMPCVLVLEKPFPGGFRAISEALGAARERWLCAWERNGQRRDQRVVRVQPVVWRSRVLGSQAVRMKRDEVRPYEQAAARMEVGPGIPIGDDEAPAILISRWGARAPQVGDELTAYERAARPHG